ncbi:MAG: hypothetical protein AAF726_12710 [Planctomycetota bacterium]
MRVTSLPLAVVCLTGSSAFAAALPQAIDQSVWVEGTQYYAHLIDTIDVDGDLIVAGHTELGGFGRGVTIYERDPAQDRWSHLQSIQVQSIGTTFHSVHYDQGRIYVGSPQFGPSSTQVYSRDASGLFVLEDTVLHQGGFNVGWVVHAEGDLLFAVGAFDLEIWKRNPSGALEPFQILTPGGPVFSIGPTVMWTQDDWLFVSQRASREIIFLRADPVTGLYAEHSRDPFPGGDFYLDRHSMTGAGERFFYGSDGGGTVLEYRYDQATDAWSVAHTITEPIPPPDGTSPSLRGFGSSLALDGDRLAISTTSPYTGGSSVFDFDAATDTWSRTDFLRSREFPAGYLSDTAIGFDDGRVAVATVDRDDNQRNIEITVWDLASDADGTLVVDASEVGVPYCNPAVINFTYVPGRLGAYQPGGPGSTTMQLVAQHLPTNAFGYLVGSSGSAYLPTPGGSRGNLCLAPGPSTGRFIDLVASSGPGGWIETTVDLQAVPVATGPNVVLAPGDVWYFQMWYRDGPTSNFTNAVEATVR